MSGFNIDGRRLLSNLTERQVKVRAASKIFATAVANELEQEAKENATWTDRTALSRQTIEGTVTQPGNKTEIVLRGNTPQFKYLELAHEKRFAILWPTVRKNMSRVVNAWAKKTWK